MCDAVIQDLPPRVRCAVLCERTFRHQIPMWRQCQNFTETYINGVPMCGTHGNHAFAEKDPPMRVVVDWEVPYV